jgi:hypothetical protein
MIGLLSLSGKGKSHTAYAWQELNPSVGYGEALKIGYFAYIEAHFCRRHFSHLAPAPYPDTGNARNRAIRIKISANICCRAATSAIWKVT